MLGSQSVHLAPFCGLTTLGGQDRETTGVGRDTELSVAPLSSPERLQNIGPCKPPRRTIQPPPRINLGLPTALNIPPLLSPSLPWCPSCVSVLSGVHLSLRSGSGFRHYGLMASVISLPIPGISQSQTARESPVLKGLTGIRGCYLQLRAVPRQGDPCSDLKLPPAPALHLLAALHTWSLWTGRQHGPNVFRLGWGTGCWAPRTALFPTPCADSHFLSLQGGSDFLLCKPGMLPGACTLPPGPPHGSARLHRAPALLPLFSTHLCCLATP